MRINFQIGLNFSNKAVADVKIKKESIIYKPFGQFNHKYLDNHLSFICLRRQKKKKNSASDRLNSFGLATSQE